MKNLFKFGFVALAISLSVAACNSNKTEEASDSTLVDTTSVMTDTIATDSAAIDTAAGVDTAAAQ